MALGPITALGYIKLGDTNIPVFQHDVFSGNPQSTNTGRPSLPNIHYATDDLWAYSVEVGTGNSANNNPMSTNAIIRQGTTPLHDSTEIVFTISDSTETAGIEYTGTALIRHQDGGTAVQINTSSQQVVSPQKSGSSNASRIRSMRYYARTYSYPQANEDAWKVKGYLIYAVQRDQVISNSGAVSNTYTALTNPYVINLPNINRYSGLYTYLDEQETPSDPNEQDPDYPSSPSDPEGDYERDYDPIPIPNTPSDGVADAGFVTIYRMTFREFDEFASKCFADDIWSAIKLKFNNPTDFLVGAMLLPFIPDVGLSYYPKFGLKTLDTAYPRISNQFHDVDCGSVNITKYWGNCFDYEPYTKIQIWLPYIGYKDLPVDEFMGQTISVKYRCDCLTGDCIAFVYTGTVGEIGPQVERVIAQFYGNCGVRVPFGSQSFDAAVAAGITLIGAAAASGLVAAGSAAIGAESGAGVLMSAGQAAGGVATGAVGRAASVGVVQGMKPNVQHGGAAGASGGYMSIQKPYLIRRIPRQSLPEGYMNLKGYPSNIGGKLADFTGLAVVDDIQLNNIPAMEDERKEIIDWLRGGVLI